METCRDLDGTLSTLQLTNGGTVRDHDVVYVIAANILNICLEVNVHLYVYSSSEYFFTARRYASAVCRRASFRLSVCLSACVCVKADTVPNVLAQYYGNNVIR